VTTLTIDAFYDRNVPQNSRRKAEGTRTPAEAGAEYRITGKG
jgi:hypothetical protein